MSLAAPDLALVLALHARSGVGARRLTRWLQWTAGRNTRPSDHAGRTRERLAAGLPAGLDHLVVALATISGEEIERAGRLIERVHHAGAQFFAVTDADYPPAILAALGAGAPPLLTVAGDAELFLRDSGGVVGSRTPSEAGGTLARHCAGWLSRRGRVVVSGGAPGIDVTAHAAAIESGGATIVVLPQGLLTYHASSNLATAIDDGDATLVSQFLPNAPWTVGGAVARNETIAALSRLVCVIDPGSRGGSPKTGQDAMNQGKPALVYPGIDALGTGRALLQAGAKPLLGPAGRFSEEYLETVWLAAAGREPKQGRLF